MEYNFRAIEKKWQQQWTDSNAYRVSNESSKPKYYVLDMFPYPSGAGLHVGHPLGYIASDIYSRYKRLKGFNVLHPMGFDAFGLPAEQYALDTGQHPAVTTKNNIATFKSQLNNIGFSYDWSREVNTSEAAYYKWTQWIFLQLFDSFFNRQTRRAEKINVLTTIFEKEGNKNHPSPGDASLQFTADQWENFEAAQKMDILMNYRLSYCGYGEVNWCEALGTVLANDEVVNGVSERGGYPVVKKKLRQWYLRITEYADRLLDGLNTVDFSDAMKEMQTNWIGKSSGAEIEFEIEAPPAPPKGGDETPKYETAQRSLYGLTKELAKQHRQNPTVAEETLWQLLRKNKTGFHIRRQHIIGAYIVDFACLDKMVTIEIDGGYHNDPEVKQYDEERTRFLKENGFTERRFTNAEVDANPEDVVKRITEALSQLPSIPQTSTSSQVSPSGGDLEGASLRVYTTRPDTIFGVDFMVIAPEHELVDQITTNEQANAVEEYITYVKSRSERERMAEKKISGVFTGAFAINPFDGRRIPVWISEYVLAGYGTGAIMAVPCGDERDHKFAKHFNIPITNIIGAYYKGEEANPTKEAVLQNSDFLNGLVMKEAIDVAIKEIEKKGIGTRKTNYKMRDAAFSRQRYWGEPFPVKWIDGVAYPLDEKELPLQLPHVDSYKPGPEGEGPLANIPEWTSQHLETNTMPGYAGSSWYFLRYMDPHNEEVFCNRQVSDYWGQVDIYIGGTEHAVGHLLYSRMWTKALFDLGFIGYDEPFRKLINQGMIQGSSRFVYRVRGTNEFVSAGLKDQYETDEIHVDVNIVDGVELDTEAFKKWREEFNDATFILENGKYICGVEVEKMSKSKYNTVNPDELVAKYGADTFRMYEMFLGPVEMSKPWDTKGIEGVHRFLKKLWRLFFDEIKGKVWNEEKATDAELKVLHKSIKQIEEATERFSFNTGVSGFMIAVNELNDLNCHKKEVLQTLLILLTPYAPHIAEELWKQLGNEGSVLDAAYP
ncbi:MAG: leucine--tRNA ligase, partial [Chitinophagaceae bacterium]